MEQVRITDPGSCPILLLPRHCTNLETNCEIWENVFMDLKITSPDSEGNLECVYSGFCNVKVVDEYLMTVQSANTTPDDSEVIIDDLQNDHSGVWIDPARSPYVYNNCEGSENTTNNVSVQQHNTYITQNVFKCNETSHFSCDDYEFRRVRKSNENVGESGNIVNLDLYGDDEFECGVFLSQLSEEILNEERTREERQFLSENNALKQLISTNKRPVKQQRTVLLIGDDSNNVHTVHNISVTDPNVECHADVGSEVVIDDTTPHKIYQCDKCKQIFDNTTTFRQHIRGSHNSMEYDIFDYKSINDKSTKANNCYRCDECGKCLKSQDKFDRHVSAHGNPELECGKCRKVYASKSSLKIHQKLHNRVYRCEWCPIKFTTKEELSVHSMKAHILEQKEESQVEISETTSIGHLPETNNQRDGSNKSNDNVTADAVLAKVMSNRVFLFNARGGRRSLKPCEICFKQFDRISDLKRHLIEHIVKSTLSKSPVSRKGTLRIQCIVCKKKVFSRVDQYKAHLREHAKLTLYKCTFCNKCFSDSSNFSKHKKIHAIARYHCDMCQRKFQSKRMIAKHMEYHMNNPPKSCAICGRLFHFDSMLNKHLKYFHKGLVVPSYQCLFCADYFQSFKDKLDHEWKIHKSRKYVIDCLLCGHKFRKYSELKKHCNLKHNWKIPLAKELNINK